MSINTDQNNSKNPKIGRTIINDFKESDLTNTISRDFRGLKEFYLNEESKEELKNMGSFKKFFLSSFWMLKSMFLRLTPARRVLLVISFILLFIEVGAGGQGGSNNNMAFIGFLLILFVLMLELKEKILAKDELEDGRRVQEALLPEKTPTVPGWSIYLFSKSANEVGGDLVDFITISQKKYGIALGDVSGKGLAAALFMANLRATIRAFVAEYPTLSKLATKVNEIFYRDRIPNSFASLLYVEFSPDSGELKFINAGHMPPIMFKKDKMILRDKGDPAIGLIADTIYKENSQLLENGDTFFVYSDGLTEARNEEGEFYGMERLEHLLPSIINLPINECADKIISTIDIWVGDASVHDDLSFFILKRIKD